MMPADDKRSGPAPARPGGASRWLATTALAVAGLAAVAPAHAFVYTEGLNPNADGNPATGSTFATAQYAADPLAPYGTVDAIQGRLASHVPLNGTAVYEVDVYRIEIIHGQQFSAATRSSNPSDDTELFLFDAGGHGLFANDDGPTDFLSTISSTSLQNGFYFLGVSLGGFEALDAAGHSIFASGGAVAGAGTLASWATPYPSFQELPFSYDIALNGVGFGDVPSLPPVPAVPEPSTVALCAAGLGLVWMRRRAQSRR